MAALEWLNYGSEQGIFVMQQKFAEMDLVENKNENPVRNLVVKGYRIIQAAWRAGRQEVEQPTFA